MKVNRVTSRRIAFPPPVFFFDQVKNDLFTRVGVILFAICRQLLNSPSGNKSGMTVSEATLDSKGRVLIPDEIRKKAGLTTGSRLRVSVSDNVVVLRKRMEPKDFISETQGVIKKGSKVKRVDPLKLKEIWIKS